MTTRAEIRWALKNVASNRSFNSAGDESDILRDMFPDSEIAQKFALGSTKTSYVINYGLAPYFKESLRNEVKAAKHFVVCFDEALNKVAQKGQMDIVVRFYDEKAGEVRTRYFNSAFLGRAQATDLLQKFLEGLEDLSCQKILQVLMDGPNVNWSFLRKLQEHWQIEGDGHEASLLDLGSCGLHVVHGAVSLGFFNPLLC